MAASLPLSKDQFFPVAAVYDRRASLPFPLRPSRRCVKPPLQGSRQPPRDAILYETNSATGFFFSKISAPFNGGVGQSAWQ